MTGKVTPSFFYGSAAAAVAGLALGFALHGPWQSFHGALAPEILFPSAQAAEPARPAGGADAGPDGSAQQAAASDPALLYAGFAPADPLPVTRLDARPDDDDGEALQAGAPDGEQVADGEDPGPAAPDAQPAEDAAPQASAAAPQISAAPGPQIGPLIGAQIGAQVGPQADGGWRPADPDAG